MMARVARRGRALTLALALGVALGVLLGLAAPTRVLAQDKAPTDTAERRDAALVEAFTAVTANAVDGTCKVQTASGHQLGFGVTIEEGLIFTAIDALKDRGASEGLRVQGRRGTATAELIAQNEAFGLALLRVTGDASLFVPVPRGEPGRLSIGQWAISVGTERRPLCAGVVSAINRRVDASPMPTALDPFGLLTETHGPERNYANVVQHDGTLTKDMRGSALLDARGRLVGVNVAPIYRGTAFATGLADLLHLLPDMREGRAGPDRPASAWLGVTIRQVAPDRRAKLGLEGAGAEVLSVVADSPAAKAGVVQGDVIRAIDAEPVEHPEALPYALTKKRVGDKVRVTVLRDGEEGPVHLETVLTARP